MARGSTAATGAAASAQNLSNTYSGNASSLFGPLSGMLESEAAHPAGIDPTTLARMDTVATEAGGGSTAGAVGQGGLLAARTRNAGGADAAIAKSARTGSETVSRGILGNRVKSAEVAEGQRKTAMSGLEGLFGQNLAGGNQALGIVPQAVNANVNEENASWDWAKDLFTPLMSAALGAGGSVAGAALKPPPAGGGG